MLLNTIVLGAVGQPHSFHSTIDLKFTPTMQAKETKWPGARAIISPGLTRWLKRGNQWLRVYAVQR